MPGAVRLADAAAAMARPGAQGSMVFGLMVAPEVFPHLAPLVERAKKALGAYIETLDTDAKEMLRASCGHCLETLEMPISARLPTHRVTVRYPLMESSVVSDDSDDERDMMVKEKECWDGVGTSSVSVGDLPCFADLDWLLDARVTLRFRDDALWCDLELDAASLPPDADLSALNGPLSRELWESAWSWNIEWDDFDAKKRAGIGDDRSVNLVVDATPKSVTTQELRGEDPSRG